MSLREWKKRRAARKLLARAKRFSYKGVYVYVTESLGAAMGERCLQVAGGQCLPTWEVICNGIRPKDLKDFPVESVYLLDLEWREGLDYFECDLRTEDGTSLGLENFNVFGVRLGFAGNVWDVTVQRDKVEPIFQRVMDLYKAKASGGVYDGVPISTADVLSALAFFYYSDGDHVPSGLSLHGGFFRDANLGLLGIGWSQLLIWCGREFGALYVSDCVNRVSTLGISSAKEVARLETELGLLHDYLESNSESFRDIVRACDFITVEGGTFKGWRGERMGAELKAGMLAVEKELSKEAMVEDCDKEVLRRMRLVLEGMDVIRVDDAKPYMSKLGMGEYLTSKSVLADVVTAWDAVCCDAGMSEEDRKAALRSLLAMADSRFKDSVVTVTDDSGGDWSGSKTVYEDYALPDSKEGWYLTADLGEERKCSVQAAQQADIGEALGFNVLDLVNGVANRKHAVRAGVPVYDVPDDLVISKASWSFVLNALDLGRYPMLLGPKGCGKSSVARAVAESRGWDFFEFDMGQVAKPKRFFLGGMIVGEGGLTQKVRSEFFTAFTSERPTLILLDEITRASGGAANFLMTVLARNQSFLYDEDLGKRFHRGKDVHIIGAGNNGYQYVSTGRLDSAFEDRFVKIVLSYLGRDDETSLILCRCPGVSRGDAYQLAGVSEALRKAEASGTLTVSLSTRQVLDAAAFVGLGYTVREVVDSVLLTNYVIAGELEEARGVLKSL